MAAITSELAHPTIGRREPQALTSSPGMQGQPSGLLLGDWMALVAGNLLRMKGRAAMTALGVLVGTAAVVVLVSLGAGLQRQALESLGTGVTELRVSATTRTSGARAGTAAEEPVIVDSDVLARIAAVPGVTWAVPFEPVRGAVDLQAVRLCKASINMVGVDPERASVLDLELAYGSLDLGPGRVVLGAQAAQQLLKSGQVATAGTSPADLVGQVVNLYVRRFGPAGEVMEKRLRFEIAGILAPRATGYDFACFIAEREAVMLNGWLQAHRRDPAHQGYAEVAVKVADVRNAAGVERKLTGMGLNVTSARQQAESLEAYFGELQSLLGSIAAISLLVSACGIANTMLMSVVERTREIGLMKALGASNRDVMAVFLGEAASLGLLGGLGGVGLGLAIDGAVNLLGDEVVFLRQMFGAGTRLQAYVPLWLPFFALGFAVIVGGISGFVPARHAARLRPIVALKA